MSKIHDLLGAAVPLLRSHSETATLDAELLLAHVLQVSRSLLWARPEQEVFLKEEQSFQELVARRQTGEPIAYLLGFKEFWSLQLKVDFNTLIPRPETELLVELLLTQLPESHSTAAMGNCRVNEGGRVDEGAQRRIHLSTANHSIKVADLGTGSGAIAIALASERPHWSVVATDCHAATLAVAEENAKRLQLHNIVFLLGNWCAPLSNQTFDAIVSNPPYIAEQDLYLQQGGLHFEPKAALVSGPTGLEAIEQIVCQARQYLKKGGCLLIEHGFNQAPQVVEMLQRSHYSHISTKTDLAGIQRVTMGQWGLA